MAKEVLLDAHLGAAHDIAWGEWKDKETSVPKWIARAARVAEDLIENEHADDEHRFRVATRALAASVGAQGKLEPGHWTRQAITTGKHLINTAEEPTRKAQLQWDLGMALYDALQVYQMRSEHDTALRYGEEAIKYLEQGNAEQRLSTASYLIGRLYFRLGAIHAIRDNNHRVAITWFEKALPHLNKPIPPEAFANLGRHGETFVSMGVSYWETGQRDKAIELTEHGANLMQKAFAQGSLDEKAMRVPFTNLAAMHRQLGAEKKAVEFEQLAERPGGTTIK
jgi:tetratricopeptide (TPR) repeat protein